MTSEERDIITRFVERVSGAGGGSVPTTGAPLPPIDKEADQLLDELFTRYPEARYRIAQLAFVQEHALAAAQNRINQLQYELARAQPTQPAARGGFFSGLFGAAQSPPSAAPQGATAPPPEPPRPTYAPGYRPEMFRTGGSGFLGSALTTAAGVAGGVVMGNALMHLFSPHAGFGGFGGGYAGPENVTIINEGANPSPWTDPGGAAQGADPTGANFDPSQGVDPTEAGFDPSEGVDPGDAGDPDGDFDDGGDFGGGDDTSI